MPRQAGKFIADNADHVKIIDQGIDRCVEEFRSRVKSGQLSLGLELYKNHPGVHPTTVTDKDIEWVFFTSALNFSFWNDDSDPPYLVTYKGKTQNGYMSMAAAINRTLDQGIPLTDAEFYANVKAEDLNKYLMGDDQVECPLIEKRVACLHEIAQVLKDKYEGKFKTCLEKCGKSALKLLEMVTQDFPCFDDSATFKGKRVALHKRAQILIADLWQLFEGKGLCEFADIDQITMFADYRVPQSLQYFGAFEYSNELMSCLKSGQIIENGDAFEVEIRGCSIEAVEQIVKKLKDHELSVTPTQVDNFLWGFRREKEPEMSQKYPFHKVRSIYY